jgi:hypothetical protein
MRVLVTGGRDYTDRDTAWKVLDALHKTQPITEIIHGAARGADTLADHWALAREVRRQLFPVSKEDWEKYGKSAGHRRNRLMHATCPPDLVLAFPGGPGTAGMVDIATKAGTPVVHSHEVLKLVTQ